MERYTASATWYDLISAERIYRVGRHAAIEALGLAAGDRVLDIGCGTGLNFPRLLDEVGPGGRVVGLDKSAPMLEVARRKADRWSAGTVRLIHADATEVTASKLLDELADGSVAHPCGFDAVLSTYALSLMPQWRDALATAVSVLKPGGRIAVVDMQPPTGLARIAAPLAHAACWLGGSDIRARPWQTLDHHTTEVVAAEYRGGHIQVRVATVPGRQCKGIDGGSRDERRAVAGFRVDNR